MNKRILVVGGAGYLGRTLVKFLQISDAEELEGVEVSVYDLLLYSDGFFINCPFTRGDVRDEALLMKEVAKCDVVVWLAAIVGDAACMIDPVLANEVNYRAVASFAEWCDKPVLFASTCSVYGAGQGTFYEDSPLNPLSLYAETKVKAEEALKGKALIIRLGTLYGLSDRMRFDLVVNAMTRDAICKGEINMFGGVQRRPLVSEVEAAIHLGILAFSGLEPGLYNYVGTNFTIAEIAHKVQKQTGADIRTHRLHTENRRDYRVSTLYDDFHHPDHTIEEAVDHMAQKLREGRFRDPYDIRYSNVLSMRRRKDHGET